MRGEEKINNNTSAQSFSYQKAEVKEGWIQSLTLVISFCSVGVILTFRLELINLHTSQIFW